MLKPLKRNQKKERFFYLFAEEEPVKVLISQTGIAERLLWLESLIRISKIPF